MIVTIFTNWTDSRADWARAASRRQPAWSRILSQERERPGTAGTGLVLACHG
jgi:hypothetical protein